MEGEAHWRAAIVLLPQLHRIRADLADNYKAAGMCTPAEPQYREVLRREPGHSRARVGLATCLVRRGAFAEARRVVREGYAFEGAADALRQTERWVASRQVAGAPSRCQRRRPRCASGRRASRERHGAAGRTGGPAGSGRLQDGMQNTMPGTRQQEDRRSPKLFRCNALRMDEPVGKRVALMPAVGVHTTARPVHNPR
jgi:hypothetical protein